MVSVNNCACAWSNCEPAGISSAILSHPMGAAVSTGSCKTQGMPEPFLRYVFGVPCGREHTAHSRRYGTSSARSVCSTTGSHPGGQSRTSTSYVWTRGSLYVSTGSCGGTSGTRQSGCFESPPLPHEHNRIATVMDAAARACLMFAIVCPWVRPWQELGWALEDEQARRRRPRSGSGATKPMRSTSATTTLSNTERCEDHRRCPCW